MLVGEEELRRLLNEVEHLRKQRTNLMVANNEEVFRHRETKEELRKAKNGLELLLKAERLEPPPQDVLAEAVDKLGFLDSISVIIGLLYTAGDNTEECGNPPSRFFDLAKRLEKALEEYRSPFST